VIKTGVAGHFLQLLPHPFDGNSRKKGVCMFEDSTAGLGVDIKLKTCCVANRADHA